MAYNTRTTAGNKMKEDIVMSNEKELEVRMLPTGMLEIKWKGGGEVPKALSGQWNSHNQAKSAITTYMASRKR